MKIDKRTILSLGLVGLILVVITLFIFNGKKKFSLTKPIDLLNISRRAMNEANYDEALDFLLKFYDLSFCQDSYTYIGVRSSFAMEIWKELNSYYPPALEKMKDIRNFKEEKLRSYNMSDIAFDPVVIAERNPTNSKDLTNRLIGEAMFRDVVSLNQALHSEERTIELFEFLQKKYPQLASACWRAARNTIMEAERYDLASEQIPDIQMEYQRLKKRYITTSISSKELAQRRFIKSIKEILAMACFLNQYEIAERIAADADKVNSSTIFERFFLNLLASKSDEK